MEKHTTFPIDKERGLEGWLFTCLNLEPTDQVFLQEQIQGNLKHLPLLDVPQSLDDS